MEDSGCLFNLLFLFCMYIDRKRGHNMLALMLDPRFKNMRLITIFLGHENVIVVEYD
jgi:hypothetical protein